MADDDDGDDEGGAGHSAPLTLSAGGHDVVLTHPDKVYFPQAGVTKADVARYYLDVAPAALVAVRQRPMIMKRYVRGIDAQAFFQKRAPKNTPKWIRTATLRYASGGHADEICVEEAAAFPWLVNIGCIEMHVHPIRMDDLERPDELRIDLDPVEGVGWKELVEVAAVAKSVLDDYQLIGFPKTSGSRGVHIWVRIERKWKFADVRKAAVAFAREVERRAPGLATSTWDKTARHGVLIDYNQNAFDRTTAAAWSVRPVPDARVSMPMTWSELASCDPRDFTIKTVPALFKKHGDPHAKIDDVAHSLDGLLELAASQPAKAPVKKAGTAARPPVLVVAKAESKLEALDGLERWKKRHPEVAAKLLAEDVIIDAMRGRSSPWFRIRVNMKSVSPELYPPPEPPDPDYEPPKIPPEIAAALAARKKAAQQQDDE